MSMQPREEWNVSQSLSQHQPVTVSGESGDLAAQLAAPPAATAFQPLQSTALRPIFSPPSPIGTFGEHMFHIQRLHMSNMQLSQQYSTPRPNFSLPTQCEQFPNPHPNVSPVVQFHPHQQQQQSRPPLWRPQMTPANIGEIRPRQLVPSHMHVPRLFDRPPTSIQQAVPFDRPPIIQQTPSDRPGLMQQPFDRPPSIQQSLPTYQDPSRILFEHSYPWIQPVDCPKVVRPIPLYARGLSPSTIPRPQSSCSGGLDTSKSAEQPNPSLQQEQSIVSTSKVLKETTPASAVLTALSPKQKKNSRIDEKTNAIFEKIFEQNKSPSQDEICEMCEKHNLTKGAVRAWFSGRRQKQKRAEKVRAMKTSHKKQSKLRVPSDSYDITVEVPSINPRDRGSVVHQDYKDSN